MVGASCHESLLCGALAAIAAAKGFPSVGKAALEMNPKTAEDFMEWFNGQ
jgi:hypothetical protein